MITLLARAGPHSDKRNIPRDKPVAFEIAVRVGSGARENHGAGPWHRDQRI